MSVCVLIIKLLRRNTSLYSIQKVEINEDIPLHIIHNDDFTFNIKVSIKKDFQSYLTHWCVLRSICENDSRVGGIHFRFLAQRLIKSLGNASPYTTTINETLYFLTLNSKLHKPHETITLGFCRYNIIYSLYILYFKISSWLASLT